MGLIGRSAAMQELRETIRLVAASSRPVLVTGPTGAGKELTVKALHDLSLRRDCPLLELNCGALPAALIESELFGHERGAFTGAEKRSDGFFTAVGNGTLFLDEIGEMPLDVQAKVLRVLETGSFRRVGSTVTLRSAARVVAATHVDLEQLVVQGRFREDLLYRLNVLEVRVPPLSERLDDIPLLVKHFMARQVRAITFTHGALQELQCLPWPGNVRQLRNLVDRVAVFGGCAPVDTLTLRKLTSKSIKVDPYRELVREVLRDERTVDKTDLVLSMMMDEALNKTNGNRTAAARMLGVHRKVLERRLEKRRQEQLRVD
jgi:DNA-binding NtrC family response regulator